MDHIWQSQHDCVLHSHSNSLHIRTHAFSSLINSGLLLLSSSNLSHIMCLLPIFPLLFFSVVSLHVLWLLLRADLLRWCPVWRTAHSYVMYPVGGTVRCMPICATTMGCRTWKMSHGWVNIALGDWPWGGTEKRFRKFCLRLFDTVVRYTTYFYAVVHK